MEPLRPEAYSARAQPVRRRSACFPGRGARRTPRPVRSARPGPFEEPAPHAPGAAAERDHQERRARSAGRLATAEFDQPDQVLWALLDNAVKYGGHGEVEVEVATEEAGGRLRLAVIDHGPGVSETDRARLFGRFELEGGQPAKRVGARVVRLARTRARDGRGVQRGGLTGVAPDVWDAPRTPGSGRRRFRPRDRSRRVYPRRSPPEPVEGVDRDEGGDRRPEDRPPHRAHRGDRRQKRPRVPPDVEPQESGGDSLCHGRHRRGPT
jgi:Histidine kinase-, DNA gyrase B-, and HSP90-like ATPase